MIQMELLKNIDSFGVLSMTQKTNKISFTRYTLYKT